MFFCFSIEFAIVLFLKIIFCHKMQIEMMFSTIITYLIWFCCCFLSLLWKEKRVKKAFEKFNFIVYSFQNVFKRQFMLRSKRMRMEQRLREDFDRKTVLRAAIKHHIRKMCLQISMLPTNLNSFHRLSISTEAKV